MKFCNLDINIFNRDQLFHIEGNKTKYIETVNAQIIVLANTDKEFMSVMQMSEKSLDGEIPLKFARIKDKRFAKCEKLSGSEIVYDFCLFAKTKNLRMFFLGGTSDSINAAVTNIKKQYGIEVSGFSPRYEDYPFSEEFTEDALDSLKMFRPDILFLGFGCPKQNYFTRDNRERLEELGIQYIIYAGGTVDFVAGKFKKCPKWMSRVGIEGLYRLFQEFSWKRVYRIIYSFKFFKYINSNPSFEKERK